ncbi:MAG: bifunctional DNA-formamidopyrimidine glycosylase/DNA-(apurinic or apyrimidinic site) lyase [Candidatus Ancillula sp.]|jgi:formamidopyrimidine-DNA glycosylase|nr:bifunctional DNA-formamidopyrimidine glycosylase/DNA-(apurinic or apyrimidinic site) lyase [Candidatus Ancillula sp.]
MPEMPEVETIRRGLSSRLRGQILERVEVLNAKSVQFGVGGEGATSKFPTGQKVEGLRRFGKLLAVDFESVTAVFHLKMTGQLVYRGESEFGGGHPSDSLIGALPDKSTRVILGFADGDLYFNDQRKFGFVKFLPTNEVENIPFVRALGPEPSSDAELDDMDFQRFLLRARRHKKLSVKAVLLDQRVVAGIGNIYADEALWMTMLHPATPTQLVTDEQLLALSRNAAKVMQTSLDHGGSTARNYVNADGQRGAYLDFANVYGRSGQPCRRCSTLLEKIRVAGRGTTYCAQCQIESLPASTPP